MAPRPINSEEARTMRSYDVCLRDALTVEPGFDKNWDRVRPCSTLHCFLYRLFNADSRLLYVGITTYPLDVRWKSHRRKTNRWPDVAVGVVECHPAEWMALISERSAIMSERPLHNRRSAVKV
jgi:hypothetical protein